MISLETPKIFQLLAMHAFHPGLCKNLTAFISRLKLGRMPCVPETNTIFKDTRSVDETFKPQKNKIKNDQYSSHSNLPVFLVVWKCSIVILSVFGIMGVSQYVI